MAVIRLVRIGLMVGLAWAACNAWRSGEAAAVESPPATRPADDLADYRIPADVTTRELPVHPGSEYAKAIGYFAPEPGKLDPVAIRRFREDGSLYSETLYREGKRFGIERLFHSNGTVKAALPYRDNLLDGPCLYWKKDGSLAGTFSVQHGTGIVKEWNDDGTLIRSSEEVNGVRTGIYRRWYSNGGREEEDHYLDDVQNGIERQFTEDGKLMSWANWQHGKLHGVLHQCDTHGVELSESPTYYVQNELVSKEDYLRAKASDPTLPAIDIQPTTQAW